MVEADAIATLVCWETMDIQQRNTSKVKFSDLPFEIMLKNENRNAVPKAFLKAMEGKTVFDEKAVGEATFAAFKACDLLPFMSPV